MFLNNKIIKKCERFHRDESQAIYNTARYTIKIGYIAVIFSRR